MKKLIVDRHQAKEIKKGKCTLVFDMKRKDGYTFDELATKKFLNQVFWVAEPLCDIKKDAERNSNHFSCDSVPDGWTRYTLDRPGSRVHYGEHRHLVKCTGVQPFAHGAGEVFSVKVALELCL